MQDMVSWFDYKILMLGLIACGIWAVAATVFTRRKK
jgi:hypothetical protein